MVLMSVWPTDGSDGSVATEARWRKMAKLWLPSGVAAGVGGEMAPALAYPNLTIAAGACWVDGHYTELAGGQVLTVTANGLAVVRFDPAANTAELLYRDGVTVPAQSPTGIWEQPIAAITASALSDRRGPLLLPGSSASLAYSGVNTAAAQGVAVGTWSTHSVFSFTIPVAGTYAVSAQAYFEAPAGFAAQIQMHGVIDASWLPGNGSALKASAGMGATITDFGLLDLAAGTHAAAVIGQSNANSTLVSSRAMVVTGVRRGT